MGSKNEVSITRTEKVMFPRKGEEPLEMAALDTALRKSVWWQQVSSLDRAALTALWKDRADQAGELRQILEQFVWIESDAAVRLRKRNC